MSERVRMGGNFTIAATKEGTEGKREQMFGKAVWMDLS